MGVPFPSLVSRHSSWRRQAPQVFPSYLTHVWCLILSDLDPHKRNTQKEMKTWHKTLDVWIKTQGLVLEKLWKSSGQALLFPKCNFGTKSKWPQTFRTASHLCKAAVGGISYKNLQLGSSGSNKPSFMEQTLRGHGSSSLIVPWQRLTAWFIPCSLCDVCEESTFEVFYISDIMKNNPVWPNICLSSTVFSKLMSFAAPSATALFSQSTVENGGVNTDCNKYNICPISASLWFKGSETLWWMPGEMHSCDLFLKNIKKKQIKNPTSSG